MSEESLGARLQRNARFLDIVATELGALAIQDDSAWDSVLVADELANGITPFVDMGTKGELILYGNQEDLPTFFKYREYQAYFPGNAWMLKLTPEEIEWVLREGALPPWPARGEPTG